MKICFTALLLLVIFHQHTTTTAQFLYPAADKFPGAECVKKRDEWVEKRVENGALLKNDNTHPDCSYKTGNYISRQCKVLGRYKVEYCRCVSRKNNDQIMVYSDANRTKLEELSYANFPVLFKDQEFTKYGCDRVQQFTKHGKHKGVIASLGLLCNPKFTKNHLCISKKTGKCTKTTKLCPKFKTEGDVGKTINTTNDKCIKERCDADWKKPLMKILKRQKS